MRKAERARHIAARLQELYPEPPIPLAHRDPYTLLIAVLLSAQCTDARVNQVTPALFARADNPRAMVELGETGVLALIRSCGLARARPRRSSRCPASCSPSTTGWFPKTSPRWSVCPASATRPPAW